METLTSRSTIVIVTSSKLLHDLCFVISSLLYWSSLEPSGKIEVSKLDGKDRRVVVNDTMEPTGIAVQHGGRLTYTSKRLHNYLINLKKIRYLV